MGDLGFLIEGLSKFEIWGIAILDLGNAKKRFLCRSTVD